MKVIGVTQARIGSIRLPGKVLLKVNSRTLLEYHLARAKQSKLVSKWIVATTDETGSDAICRIARKLSVSCFKGSTTDVLERFYKAAVSDKPDYVVRITSDCPLIDGTLIDEAVQICLENKLDYYSNDSIEKYPHGLDVEVFTFSQLKKANKEAKLPYDREHVTPYIRKQVEKTAKSKLLQPLPTDKSIGKKKSKLDKAYFGIRITVDERSDFEVIKHLIANLGGNQPWKVYADYLLKHNEIREINNSAKWRKSKNSGNI